ncbi:DUF6252 family protein [Christiangramia sediminis]|uniref:DUF6252 family protein n=1 Tax=Christiangramia sediminis TaxID=2881336 RepID=A0A9X1RVL9_9FLAO|nr:DUF6252 family protein [Christiangramia sediminis]MCB7480246.1 DUF6252 family protein [Christiangramia sediminis]
MKSETLTFYLLVVLFTTSCSKDSSTDCDNPVDCLPEMTQTGANTAGCLVNGKILTPGGQSLNSGSVLKAQYNFYQGSYLFGLSIRNRGEKNRMLNIEIRNQKLIAGETYSLQNNSSSSFASYRNGILGGYITNNERTGEIYISFIDSERNIISGTFHFDAENNEGEVIEVRQGRFDVKYY